MTDNIPSSYEGKTGENTVIEYVKDDVDEIPDSDFSKASARIFDEIDNGKDGVLPPSKCIDLIKSIGEIFHSEDLVGHP